MYLEFIPVSVLEVKTNKWVSTPIFLLSLQDFLVCRTSPHICLRDPPHCCPKQSKAKVTGEIEINPFIILFGTAD